MNPSPILEETPVPDRKNAPLSGWERQEMPPPTTGPEWNLHRLNRTVRFTDIYSARRADEKRLREAEESAAAAAEAAEEAAWASLMEQRGMGPSPTDLADAKLVEEFSRFLSMLRRHMAGQAEGEESSAGPPKERPRKRRIPFRTPNSDVPITAVKPAELLRPEFSRGKLYFSCPCCRFPAALPVWLAGRKVLCPRCYSAIRAPHPRKGLQARVYENDVESIVHPERFQDYRNAHRLIPFLGIPRPKLYPSFQAAGILMLVIVLGIVAPSLLRHRAAGSAGLIAAASDPIQGPDLKDRARAVVENFMAAGSVEAKSGYVRDPGRVAPLMADWYQRHPNQIRPEKAKIEVSGAGFYAGNVDHPVTDVRVASADGQEQIFTVEHGPDGDRIEWESSVGYTVDLKQLMTGKSGDDARVVRVVAALDDYYNFDYQNPEGHVCVRIHDPETLELVGYGYLPAKSPDVQSMVSHLAGSSVQDLRPLMIEVKPGSGTARTRQVAITKMVEAGWRNSGAMAANAK